MEPKKAKYKLEDLDVVEVSFVPKAANKRKFLLYKAADEAVEKDGPTADAVHVDVPLGSNKDKGKIAAETKTEGGKAFRRGDYAYAPDGPSTWKLRLTNTPGGAPDTRIVGAAVAALGKGFRGNKVQIPSSAMAGVKAKVRAAWKKANPSKTTADLPAVLKEAMMHEDILKALEGELEGADEVDVTLKEAKVSERGMTAIKAALMILKAFKEDISEVVGQQVPVLAGWAAPEPVEVIKEVEVAPKTEAVKKAEVLESASPELKAELEKLWKAQAESTKKQAELEATIKAGKDATELATFVRKAATDFAQLPAKADELGQALQMISKAATNGEADLIDRILKAANEAIARTSEEIGGGGGSEETSVMARVDAQAAEMVKKGEAKSPSQAITMIFEKDPSLYTEYNKQSPVAVVG